MASTADIIRAWTDETDRVTRKEVADAADCAVQTVGRWISGEAELSMEHYRRLVSVGSRLPLGLKLAVAESIHRAASLRVCEAGAPTLRELDADGDGRVTSRDPAIHATRAACEAAASIRTLVEQGRLGEAQQTLHQAERHLRLARESLEVAAK